MEIKIGKSARACRACDKEFAHDEELKSLVKLENQLLTREDYCEACWQIELAKGAFSVWSSRFYDPRVAEQEPPEVFSPLRRTFYEAVESKERLELAKAYLAAQLLRRQKVFRFIREANEPDGDVRVALFADRIGNTLVEVRDPDLSYDEMEQGRRALLERLAELEMSCPDAQTGEVLDETAEGPGQESTGN